MHTLSIDVDLPVEVDDEFWDHPDPAHRFVQPEGKLCIRSFNIYVTKLREILSDALRTIVRGVILCTFSTSLFLAIALTFP